VCYKSYEMHLASLTLTDFRNLADVQLSFDPDVHVIFGENAQGKTNLLESIHYLATLRTFRGQSSRDLIRALEDGSRQPGTKVSGEVVGPVGRDDLSVTLSGENRKINRNGKEPGSVASYLETLSVVRFVPDDILLFKGPSQPRRRILDRAVFALNAAHLGHLQDYNRALGQKNRLLRGGRRWVDPSHRGSEPERGRGQDHDQREPQRVAGDVGFGRSARGPGPPGKRHHGFGG